MNMGTIKGSIDNFFRYLWPVCFLVVFISFASVLFNTYAAARKAALETAGALASDLDFRLHSVFRLLDSLAEYPVWSDGEEPNAAGFRLAASLVRSYALLALGEVVQGNLHTSATYAEGQKALPMPEPYASLSLPPGEYIIPTAFSPSNTVPGIMLLASSLKERPMLFAVLPLSGIEGILWDKLRTNGEYNVLMDARWRVIAGPGPLGTGASDALGGRVRLLWEKTRYGVPITENTVNSGCFVFWNGGPYIVGYTSIVRADWMLLHVIPFFSVLRVPLGWFLVQAAILPLIFFIISRIGKAYLRREAQPVEEIFGEFIEINREMNCKEGLDHKDMERILELSSEGMRDELTGLRTRVAFMQELHHRLEGLESATLGALFFFDLDEMGSINREYGHERGDALIRRFTGYLRDFAAGRGGICGRYGGDEFLLYVGGIHDDADAEAAAAAFLAELQLGEEENGESPPCRVSIGIALYPRHAAREDDLLNCADMALYQAKQRRKGRAVLYAFGMFGQTSC